MSKNVTKLVQTFMYKFNNIATYKDNECDIKLMDLYDETSLKIGDIYLTNVFDNNGRRIPNYNKFRRFYNLNHKQLKIDFNLIDIDFNALIGQVLSLMSVNENTMLMEKLYTHKLQSLHNHVIEFETTYEGNFDDYYINVDVYVYNRILLKLHNIQQKFTNSINGAITLIDNKVNYQDLYVTSIFLPHIIKHIDASIILADATLFTDLMVNTNQHKYVNISIDDTDIEDFKRKFNLTYNDEI